MLSFRLPDALVGGGEIFCDIYRINSHIRSLDSRWSLEMTQELSEWLLNLLLFKVPILWY